jgi:adenylosuccinate synthase
VIANGVLVDLDVLFREIDELTERGVPAGDRVVVSDRAQLVMPYHKRLDALREESAVDGQPPMGTTKRGIGPCLADKVTYRGIRVADLAYLDRVADRVRAAVAAHNRQFEAAGAAPADADETIEKLRVQARRLEPMVRDTVDLLRRGVEKGEAHLYEGAQAVLLDVDLGTYPYVTGTNASAAGLWSGTGVPPWHVRRIVGVVKAYTTRVDAGDGPFPTETFDAVRDHLASVGREFGTVTGRPRRCGWLDLVALRYALAVNGCTEIALTKLDVLTGLDPLRIAVAYELDGRELHAFPASAETLRRVTPRWVELPGWTESIGDATTVGDLPAAAREYVRAIERHLGRDIRDVSVGPERHQMVSRGCGA